MDDLSRQEVFLRTGALFGQTGMELLARAHVAVFGIGGVGGYVAEGLARSGVGTLTLIDGDSFSQSNLNRQLFATVRTLGRSKVEAAKETLALHAPFTQVQALPLFFCAQTAEQIPFSSFDYIVDAMDDVAAKCLLLSICAQKKIPLLCAMGAGNKLDPTAFRVADLSKTKVDPLARVIRKEAGKVGIFHAKVVYSEEPVCKMQAVVGDGGKSVGSFAPVVGAMGFALCAQAICDLCAKTTPCIPHGKEGAV